MAKPAHNPLRFPVWPTPEGWLLLVPAAALILLAWAGWAGGLLQGGNLTILYFVLLGAVLNTMLLAALFWAWSGLGGRRARRREFNRELGYLRGWSGEEGRLRKQGLIREINALGGAPEDLEQAVLEEADLKGADLKGCNLKGADLRQANLHGAALDGADLWGADLTGANLTMASLRNANLRSSNLTGAELVKAQVAGASFHRCTLVNANVYGTDLARAGLERARFAGREQGAFRQTVHPSVEDWIRERLDGQGRYTSRGAAAPEEGEAPARKKGA